MNRGFLQFFFTVGTNVRNDLQRPTTTYNDPTTTLQRPTMTYNDATTIYNHLQRCYNDLKRSTTTLQ